MRDPDYWREQARRCRVRLKTAVEPEVIDQLRVWAVELADQADEAERARCRARRNRRIGADHDHGSSVPRQVPSIRRG